MKPWEEMLRTNPMTTGRMDADAIRRARITVELDLDFACSCDNDDGAHDDDCEGTALQDAWESLMDDHTRSRSAESEKDAIIKALSERVESLRMSLDSGDMLMSEDAASELRSHVDDLEAALKNAVVIE